MMHEGLMAEWLLCAQILNYNFKHCPTPH